MLAAYTINAAFATRLERETGSLEPGKAADLIILDRNLFSLPPSEIQRAHVLLTMLDGQAVYRDTTFLKD
ncbi:MAG: amidohydrolase family protein, partial [Gemmatimonadota bacterium]